MDRSGKLEFKKINLEQDLNPHLERALMTLIKTESKRKKLISWNGFP